MNRATELLAPACRVLEAAEDFRGAAARPGSWVAAPGALACLEDALRAISAGCYQLAADVGAEAVASHEQKAHLTATVQDLAAACARCARGCREARSVAASITAPEAHHVRVPR